MNKEGQSIDRTVKESLFEHGLRLGSTSTHKLEALKEACRKVGIDTEIIGSPAESEINAQPYGFEETYAGAMNRAKHAQSENHQSVAIGIENGIIPINDKFIDLAIVIVLTPDGQSFVATSAGIEFPKEAVQEAKSRGFQTATAGDIIAETRGGSKADPHSALTEGKIIRKDLLVEALTTALSQFLSSTRG